MAQPWTDTEDIVERWRPLSDDEVARAPGAIGQVERAIARRWPDIDARLADPTSGLTLDDVHDVVANLARQLLEIDPDLPMRAKSWQTTSGTEGMSVVLDGSLAGAMLTFDEWMVDALNGPVDTSNLVAASTPLFYAPPPSRRLERAMSAEWWDEPGSYDAENGGYGFGGFI